MKRAPKKKSSIYQFLEPFLATGNEDIIAKARKEYKRKYSAGWRQQQRLKFKHYMIDYSPSEAKLVIDAARKHKSSTTAFIKKACFAYMNKRYLNKDVYTMNEIFQALTKNYSVIKNLQDDNVIQYQVGSTLIQQMNKLESELNTVLLSPKSLEKWIIETIQDNPQYKETIEKILNNINFDS